MIDFVLTGIRGFVGGYLRQALTEKGYRVIDEAQFRASPDQCVVFVNCSNIAENPATNVTLTGEKYSLARKRSKYFVQPMSFITLVGEGELDPTCFNFGFSPRVLDHYSAGKLEQERFLCSVYKSGSDPAIALVYLPIVLGEGGGWSNLLASARRNGVILPAKIGPAARVNFIDVAEFANYLVALHAREAGPEIERAIVNNPESARLTWDAFFSGAPRPAIAPKPSLKRRIRSRIEQSIFRFLYKAGLLLPIFQQIARLRKVPGFSKSTPDTTEPVKFSGTMVPLICEQEYLQNF
jgi:nucleoside-diphosphate-sugar epimerase